MTYKQGSFTDSTTAVQTFIGILHSDLIANGWQLVESGLDSGAFRWQVYKNPASNNSLNKDYFIGLGQNWASGTAGIGTVSTLLNVTIFEQWNSTLKLATNYPVWSAAAGGYTNEYLAAQSIIPRNLPSTTVVLPVVGVTVNSPGGGWTVPATVSVSVISSGSGASFSPVMELDTVVVSAAGTGYPPNQTALACDITGGGGDGSAVVTATTNGSGVITGYSIVNRGATFTSLPTITPSTAGGGSGATTTVRLRVKSVTIVSGGALYNAGITLTLTGGSAAGTTTVAIDSGFAYGSIACGATSTQYFYTVTNDMLAFAVRRDGSTDGPSWYLGSYESLQSSDYDPFPIVCCYLFSSTSGQVLPSDGYGFFTREPRRSPQAGQNAGLRFDLAAVASGQNALNGAGPFQPLPGGANDGYSGLPYVCRCTVSGRGQISNWRGFLRNVVNSGSTGTAVNGDGIYWTIGATTYFATRVGANTFIIQV